MSSEQQASAIQQLLTKIMREQVEMKAEIENLKRENTHLKNNLHLVSSIATTGGLNEKIQQLMSFPEQLAHFCSAVTESCANSSNSNNNNTPSSDFVANRLTLKISSDKVTSQVLYAISNLRHVSKFSLISCSRRDFLPGFTQLGKIGDGLREGEGSGGGGGGGLQEVVFTDLPDFGASHLEWIASSRWSETVQDLLIFRCPRVTEAMLLTFVPKMRRLKKLSLRSVELSDSGKRQLQHRVNLDLW